jgi:hypothetical protein
MRDPFTFEERVALWVLGALLACVAVAFVFAANQAGAAEAPPMSKSAVLPPRVWYFAATATDSDELESDYSNELVWTNSTRARGVTLTWDASVSPNITNYKVYWGRSSNTYTSTVSAGTNLTLSLRLTPVSKTNRIVHVSFANASKAWTATHLSGPWAEIAATNVTLTNPAPSQLWRVEQPAKVVITKEML